MFFYNIIEVINFTCTTFFLRVQLDEDKCHTLIDQKI